MQHDNNYWSILNLDHMSIDLQKQSIVTNNDRIDIVVMFQYIY